GTSGLSRDLPLLRKARKKSSEWRCVSETDANRWSCRGLLSRRLLPRFCGRASRLLSRRLRPRFTRRRLARRRGYCRTFAVRGRAVRYGRRLLARRRANIAAFATKLSDEIVCYADLDDRFAAARPEFFDGFLGALDLAIKLPVEAAEPLELVLGLADLLRRI